MIRINLIPQEEVQRSAGRRQQVAVGLLVGAATAVLLGGAHGWQQVSSLSASRERGRLERQLAELKGPYDQVVKMEKEKQELQDKLNVIRELEAKKFGPVRMLSDLSGATPDKLWLTDFSEKGGSIRLSGLGVDEQTVADFMRRLSMSPYFRNVDLEETSEAKGDPKNASNVGKSKRFVIRAQVNYAASRAKDGPKQAKGEESAPEKVAKAEKPVPDKAAKAAEGDAR
jgi:type IV pilus assembly protein PilN